MGPVDQMARPRGKLFAALYALFSGVVFIGVMGVVLAPWAHRLLHVTQAEERASIKPVHDRVAASCRDARPS